MRRDLIVGVPVTYRLSHRRPPVGQRADLDEQQAAVAAHPGGPLLVLAGPGTGKTTTLVETVARRVEAGADPASLLLLTFSRRAAGELRERLALRLGGMAAPAAWTFHSFCLALLTEEQARIDPAQGRPRLLGGPEQEVVVREMLRGDLEDGRAWPAPLGAVLDTHGLAVEVRALISRAQLVGLDPSALHRIAGGAGAGGVGGGVRPDWQAVAGFFQRYLEVIEAQGLLDYADLVARAAELAWTPEVLTRLRARFAAVWVDEFQDTDPVQERLLQALAGDGRDLVVVGDPDQAIYAFRGADVSGILQFGARFPTADGSSAPVLALGTCRRSGADLVAATRRSAALLPAPGLPAREVLAHRALRPAGPAGQVVVVTFAGAGMEAEWIADALRRAHLDDGVPWRSMAVLVRSGSASIPLLRRVLGGLGVPVEVAADEVALAHEPAVAPLVMALRCAARPDQLTAERVGALLSSPLIGADATQLRSLGRALLAGARTGGELLPGSAELIRRSLLEPPLLRAIPRRAAAPALALRKLLDAAATALGSGGSPAQALWELWSGSAWRGRLEELAGGNGADARAADRDLDAVVALFDAVSRAEEQRPGIGVGAVLDTIEAQQIPAGADEERAVRRPGVRLLTAHRSKGLEWELVVVAGVQEGSWPDLRPRGSLLRPDELGPGGRQSAPDAAGLLADERRLFYVACTRARSRLLVTAVGSAADDGERPSRFLRELGVAPIEVTQRVARPRTLAGLVAGLRCDAVDPAATPALRQAAAARLGRLARARDEQGRPLVPAADPASWWGMRERTGGTGYDAEAPVALSASTLSGLSDCPLRWFLGHEVHAEGAATVALGFGRVIHALADAIARGQLEPRPEQLLAELDRVWPALGYQMPWHGTRERAEAAAALQRLARQLAASDRELLGTEIPFDATVTLAGGQVRLRGRADRVEIEADGAVVVVDLKTGKTSPTKTETAEHQQLALYQFVVDAGHLEGLPSGSRSGGAELWQLRSDGDQCGGADPGLGPKVMRQVAAVDHGGLLADLDEARARILAEDFPATPGNACRTCSFTRCCPMQDAGRTVVA